MLKIYASDLSFASQVFKSGFDSIKVAASSMQTEIDKFVNNPELKNNLKGISFDTARRYMDTYKDSFTGLSSLCDTLSSNIVSANNSVISAMQGHSPVDIDSEEELKSQIKKLNDNIAATRPHLYKTKKTVDAKGRVCFVETGEINQYWYDRIQEYSREIRELDELIKIVQATRAAYEAAKGQMNGELGEVLNSFLTKTSTFLG